MARKKSNFRKKDLRAAKRIAILTVALIVGAGGYINADIFQGDMSGECVVIRVVDGDTIHVRDENGRKLKVRLIGIDTPESVHPDKSRNVPMGKVASNFTKTRLLHRKVKLEYDTEPNDRYGRTLAYVYKDGKMFNETLVEEGYAKVMTIPPNVKYSKKFLMLQREARRKGKGIWSD